jgi:hypothetical protein
VHDDLEPPGPAAPLAQRVEGEDALDLRFRGRGQPVPRLDGRVGQPAGHGGQGGPGRPGPAGAVAGRLRRDRLTPPRAADRAGGPVEQLRALGQHELDVLAHRDLDPGVVLPLPDRIPPGRHVKVPQPLGGHGDLGAEPVGARGQFPHRHRSKPAAVRVLQHHGRAQQVVTLAEHRGADFE